MGSLLHAYSRYATLSFQHVYKFIFEEHEEALVRATSQTEHYGL